MEKSFIIFLFISLFITYSCEEKMSDNINYGDPYVTGISNSGCKEPDLKCTRNEDCVIYETVNDSCLLFKRINVAFNCCFDSVIIGVDVDDNNTITITEVENAGNCKCNCIYDIEYIIGPLNYGLYNVIIDEQYADSISFTIDFNEDTQGEYCVERTGYPWD